MSTFKLPRLPLNWDKQPQLFERYWDEAMSHIEKTLNAILDIPAIRDALNGTIAASLQQAIASSFPVDLVMTVSDVGVITVANHIRRYTDGHADVAITGGTITTAGLSSGDVVSVAYDDPNRLGGAVTYHYYTDDVDAHVSATNISRHYVGYVQLPVSGDPPADGGGAQPPGGSPGGPRVTGGVFDGGTA